MSENKLPSTEAASGEADTVFPHAGAPSTAGFGGVPGYRIASVIGVGGMGEVVLAHDERIGRDVAIKRMRGDRATGAGARFLREAQIQARLEHPAIVPVHELGVDANDQPYFTMKRLSGVTLAKFLVSDPPPPRQRLLRIFVDICHAIEFTHSNHVIHRDLKPENIMLGDFGEVYVLDWGLARTTGDHEPTSRLAGDSADGNTMAGAMLGTPGYMAPEQVRGDADIGRPADVYALGALLFEMLVGTSLHPRGHAALLHTMEMTDGSPARRHPDRGVPPELDEACAAALAFAPGQRPTASHLADLVDRYLDGDRDLERRRELARVWLDKAQAALATDAIGLRAEALQFAGRAIVLDPESRESAELFTTLALEAPRHPPPGLLRELAGAETAVQRRQSRVAALTFLAIAAFLLVSSLSGLRSRPFFLAICLLAAVLTAVAFRLSQRRATTVEMMMVVVGNATLAMLLSRAFGSVVLAPAVTCVMAVSLTSYPQLIEKAKAVIAILLVSWTLPVLLERTGVLEPTWWIGDDRVISTSTMLSIGPSTSWLLIGANVLTIVVIGLFANALARSRRDAQRQVEVQAWNLRQLLPSRAAP